MGFACWNFNSWTLNILAVISTACWGSTAWGNVVLASLDGTGWALVLLTLLLDALDVTLFGAAASLASSDAPDVTIHSVVTLFIDAHHLCCDGADRCSMSSWSLGDRSHCWVCSHSVSCGCSGSVTVSFWVCPSWVSSHAWMSSLGASCWWSVCWWSHGDALSCAWLSCAVATSGSLAAFVHIILNLNVWSLACELAHIWTVLADTGVCVWHTLVLGWGSNAFLASLACWWCWLLRAFNWNALLLLATTQVSSLLSVCLQVTGNHDILACILSARNGTVGSAAASLAIRDSPLLTVLVLSSVSGKAEWWAGWSDMSVSWHSLSSCSSGFSVNLRI